MSPPSALPDDAGDLQGFYFRLLLGTARAKVSLVAAAPLGAALGAVLFGGTDATVAGLIAGPLVALGAIFAQAATHSEAAFFNVYGQLRGMTAYGKGRLPEATPLLRKGEKRYAERALEGDLAPGMPGTVALYTYVEESGNGRTRQASSHSFTVGIADVPEGASFVPELYCERNSGPRALQGLEDAFDRSRQRVRLESEALEARYEIFAGGPHSPNRLRQLFSPTFIVWLAESAPEGFGFEFERGRLCCYLAGHRKTATELDAIRTATATVATRLREEALE